MIVVKLVVLVVDDGASEDVVETSVVDEAQTESSPDNGDGREAVGEAVVDWSCGSDSIGSPFWRRCAACGPATTNRIHKTNSKNTTRKPKDGCIVPNDQWLAVGTSIGAIETLGSRPGWLDRVW